VEGKAEHGKLTCSLSRLWREASTAEGGVLTGTAGAGAAQPVKQWACPSIRAVEWSVMQSVASKPAVSALATLSATEAER